jgi:hypothetical protein
MATLVTAPFSRARFKALLRPRGSNETRRRDGEFAFRNGRGIGRSD